jgi:uncharacterized protein (TIGR02145 family)
MKKTAICFALILITIFEISCKKKATKPLLTTSEVTGITSVSALSGGTITNDGGDIIVLRGICWSLQDNPTMEDNITSESGTSNSFTLNITGLSPKTKYYVRSFAQNVAGTGYGESKLFETLGDKPTSTIPSATNILLNSATLNGSVNPNFLSTTVTFEYGTTTSYGSTISAAQSPITGGLSVNVSADISGLNPGTTYHFRIKAENSLGTTYSTEMTFTTLGQVPTTAIQPATDILINGAVLKGTVNANYLSSTASFEWGKTTSYGNSVTATQNPVTGSTPQTISANLSGLTPGTTYHYRIKAENSLGTAFSGDISFTTLGKVPDCSSLSATNVTPSSVTLNGLINPNYLPTTVIFEYGIDDSYGSSLAASQSPVSGSSNINVNVNLTGLTELTLYHYRIKAENSLGSITSRDTTFSTIGIVTDVDGNSYKTVLIGNQKWMAENLRTKHFSNGSPIFNGETVPNNCDSKPYYFNYNQDPNNSVIYGLLYNYYAASNSSTIEPRASDLIPSGIQGACPTGWHTPSFPEMEILINFLGGKEIAGGKLKSTQLWDSPNLGATNASNFNALPAGAYDKLNFNYSYLGQTTFIWSTSGGTDYFRGMYLINSSDKAALTFAGHRCTGSSIRCIKD